jgi:hypothetical protein
MQLVMVVEKNISPFPGENMKAKETLHWKPRERPKIKFIGMS